MQQCRKVDPFKLRSVVLRKLKKTQIVRLFLHNKAPTETKLQYSASLIHEAPTKKGLWRGPTSKHLKTKVTLCKRKKNQLKLEFFFSKYAKFWENWLKYRTISFEWNVNIKALLDPKRPEASRNPPISPFLVNFKAFKRYDLRKITTENC